MLGEIIPIGGIICNEETSPAPEINWPPVAAGEEGSETDWFKEAQCEKGTEFNWPPLAVGEKENPKINGVPGFSPVGLKVLVVDDNRVCLAVAERMLNRCKYTVTTCSSAAMALTLVQDKSTPFDLVLCDVHMPGMDGFKLLEALEEIKELPVIMMSSDDETQVILKGIRQGACDYFLKPVTLQRLRTIWQHVVRRRDMVKDTDCERDNSLKSDRDNCRKRKGKEEAMDDTVEFVNGNKKKTRLVWTSHLHKQFVDAVAVLGTSNAVPKQILEKMNVKGISRENVASHLQKYRKYLADQEALNDDAKDPVGGGLNGLYQTGLEAYQTGGHFGGSIEIQSLSFMTSLHSPNSMPLLHSPNAMPLLHSPNTMPSLHSTNTVSSLYSSNTVSSLHSPNILSSLHSSNTLSSLHSPNTMSPPLHSPNTMAPLRSSNAISSLHFPNTMSSHRSSNTMTSLHSPNITPSIHSVDSITASHHFPEISRHTSPSIHNSHGVNIPSQDNTPVFPIGRSLPSFHSHQAMPSFPAGRTVPSLHSAPSGSSGYSVNTELYPVPSQSFQAVEAGNFRSCITPEPLVPSFDVASSSNFPNRIRPFSNTGDVHSPTIGAPAFYNTEYQN